MKKVVILGASGLIGSHLALHYSEMGAQVYAVTRNPGLVSEFIGQHCELRMGDETNLAQCADLVVDCSARPTNYGYGGVRHKYKHLTGAPNVLLSTTLLLKEDHTLAPWANTEYIMDSYNAERIILARSGHVLRLPQVSIEGHLLSKSLLVASERMSLEHSLLQMQMRPEMDLTVDERAESVRDIVKITDVPKYVEAALKHPISHVSTDAPKTIREHIKHFANNYLGDPSIVDRVSYYSEAGVNNHAVSASYLPNLFSIQ